jgi:hypothetical protein
LYLAEIPCLRVGKRERKSQDLHQEILRVLLKGENWYMQTARKPREYPG